jgi:hypothetical protein
LEQGKLTSQQVFETWEQAHEELKDVVSNMPSDKFPGDLLYPWGGENGSIAQLVEYMYKHDVEHRDEISKALKG